MSQSPGKQQAPKTSAFTYDGEIILTAETVKVQKSLEEQNDTSKAQLEFPQKNKENFILPPVSLRTKKGQDSSTQILEWHIENPEGRSADWGKPFLERITTKYALLSSTSIAAASYLYGRLWWGDRFIYPEFIRRNGPFLFSKFKRNYVASQIVKASLLNLTLFIFVYHFVGPRHIETGGINANKDRNQQPGFKDIYAKYCLYKKLEPLFTDGMEFQNLFKYESVKYPSAGEAAINLGLDPRLAAYPRQIKGYTDDPKWEEYFSVLDRKIDNSKMKRRVVKSKSEI